MSTLIEPAGSHGMPPTHRGLVIPALRVRGDGLRLRLMAGYEFLAGIVIAVFWLRSGLAHVTNSYYFLSSVYSYEIVGPALGIAVAVGLPALQLVLAGALLARRFLGGALLLSAGLLIVFAAVQVSALVRGLKIGCGCFGPTERPIGGESLATTSLLLVCAVSAFLCWLVDRNPRRA
jgi:Methylamine utilisation protein MauE